MSIPEKDLFSSSNEKDKQPNLSVDLLLIFSALCIGFWLPFSVLLDRQNTFINVVFDAGFSALAIVGALTFRSVSSRGTPLVIILAEAFPAGAFLTFLNPPLARAAFLLKITEMRHLKRLSTAVSRLDFIHPILGRLIPMMFFVPLVLHWTACGWIALGSGNSEPTSDFALEYTRALYWSVTTLATVGYGDITPRSIPQMVFASCIMIVGVGFFGFVLGNVASLISRMDSAKVHQAETLDRVESFMGYHDIPQNLRQKVRAYYRYLWESRRGYDDGAVLTDLPSNLRSDIAMFMNGDVIEKVPLLKGADPEVMRDIVLQLRPIVTIPGEEIFRHGEVGEAMYFIQRGTVEILASNGNLIVNLRDGQFFGEMALLNNSPRSATAKSSSYCDLFMLERKAFEKVLARHPQFEANIRETTLARTQKSA